MTTYITPDNKLHDDADGFALTLPSWPQNAVLASEEQITAIQTPPKTLSELKVEKNLEINLARLEATQSTFTHAGKTFACDQLSRSDIDGINGYVGTRNSLPTGWVGGWKAADNTILPIADVAAWNAFYDSMIAQGQANFMHSQSLKAQLSAATTAEQVAAITW